MFDRRKKVTRVLRYIRDTRSAAAALYVARYVMDIVPLGKLGQAYEDIRNL
jgi:hypothetical protein